MARVTDINVAMACASPPTMSATSTSTVAMLATNPTALWRPLPTCSTHASCPRDVPTRRASLGPAYKSVAATTPAEARDNSAAPTDADALVLPEWQWLHSAQRWPDSSTDWLDLLCHSVRGTGHSPPSSAGGPLATAGAWKRRAVVQSEKEWEENQPALVSNKCIYNSSIIIHACTISHIHLIVDSLRKGHCILERPLYKQQC